MARARTLLQVAHGLAGFALVALAVSGAASAAQTPAPADTLRVGGDAYAVRWVARDDFSGADWRNRWAVETGAQGKAPARVGVRGGRLVVDDPTVSEGVTVWRRQPAPADFVLRFRFGLDAASPEGTFVVFAAAREVSGAPLRVGARDGDYESYQGGAGIEAYLASLTLDYARLRRLPAFDPALATDGGVRSVRGRAAEVVLAVERGRVRAYIGGAEVYDHAFSDPLPAGHLALRNWHTRAWWDDVEVGEIVGAAARSQASPVEDDRPDYGALARRYADVMLAHGRPAGAGEGRAFSTMLDRQSLALPERPDERLAYWLDEGAVGVRSIDRAWNASNPFHDAALYDLLDRLAEDTGDARYRAAADGAIAWHLGHAQHPETGLVAWGEHLGWRLDTDEAVEHNYGLQRGDDELYFNWGHLKHETEPFWSQWDRAVRVGPAAFQRYADGYWEYQVYDHARGLHAHQTRWDRFEPDSGFVFPRTAGHGVLVWALAHRAADTAERRAELERRIALVARTEAGRRHPESDAAPFLHPVNAPTYEGINDLAAAYDVARAAEVETLPDGLRQSLRAWAARSDRTILALDHDPSGAGFVGKADLATLAPASRIDATWCKKYPGYTVASMALAFLARADQPDLDDDRRQRYRGLGLAAARRYLGTEPACETTALWPGAFADAVALHLAAHRLTGDAAHLADADRLGRRAVELFLDDGSALPRVALHPRHTHYEAITGGPDLMLALLDLGQALEASPLSTR